MSILKTYNNEILLLCESHKVKSLYAFGSVVSDSFNENSDVDFIVDFYPINIADYANNYFDLKFSLEKTLKRKIDLLEDKAIKNPYFKQVVNKEKQLIYG